MSYESIMAPDQVQSLVVEPVLAASIATSICGVIQTDSAVTRFPAVTANPQASWVNEGEEIPLSDAETAELVVTPGKLAALTVISSELANDTSPAALETVGAAAVRDLTAKIDQAFFGTASAPAPTGLPKLEGVTETTGAIDSLDIFVDHTAAIAAEGGTITAWVANPKDAADIAKIRTAEGSNLALLTTDPTQPARRIIEGAPLYTSPAVAEGTIWTLDSSAAHICLRQNAELITDRSAFFTSDQVALRATLRIGWGFSDPTRVGKITISGAE